MQMMPSNHLTKEHKKASETNSLPKTLEKKTVSIAAAVASVAATT